MLSGGVTETSEKSTLLTGREPAGLHSPHLNDNIDKFFSDIPHKLVSPSHNQITYLLRECIICARVSSLLDICFVMLVVQVHQTVHTNRGNLVYTSAILAVTCVFNVQKYTV